MATKTSMSIFDTSTRKASRMNGGDSITASAYNLIIGGVLLYGFIANAIIVWIGSEFFTSLAEKTFIGFILVYFILCICGSLIAFKSTNPFVSFLGYNLIVVPIGAVLAISLPSYTTQNILLAIITTGAVTAIMTFLGATFPRIFAKMGRTLFISLFITIIVEIIAMFSGFYGGIFDYIVTGIFSLYIGYDWQKAMMYPKTADNAVDSALDLYLDIINLFIRLLRIISRSRD